MNEYSPCEIGDIISWDRVNKILHTTIGDLPHSDVFKDDNPTMGWDWIVVELPWGGFAPVCMTLWEYDASTHH